MLMGIGNWGLGIGQRHLPIRRIAGAPRESRPPPRDSNSNPRGRQQQHRGQRRHQRLQQRHVLTRSKMGRF